MNIPKPATPILKIHEVEAFRAVMIRGTATDAAVLLHTSQPVISKLIARFQRSIGIKLFELRKSRLVPTREAHILFKTIEQTYVGLDHVARTVSELQGGHSGRLAIGSLPSFAMGALPAIAAKLLKDEPKLQISIETLSSGHIRQSVVSGKIDLGIAQKGIDTAGVQAQPLISVRTACVMNRDHPLSGKRRITASDLEGMPMVMPARDNPSRHDIDRMLAEQGVVPIVAAETTYAVTMCLLALQGAGCALVSPFAAMALRKAGLLVKRFEPSMPIDLLLLTALDTSPSRITTAFVERLRLALARMESVL